MEWMLAVTTRVVRWPTRTSRCYFSSSRVSSQTDESMHAGTIDLPVYDREERKRGHRALPHLGQALHPAVGHRGHRLQRRNPGAHTRALGSRSWRALRET